MNWRKHLPVTAEKWDRFLIAWSELRIAKAELKLSEARLRQIRLIERILDRKRMEAAE